MKKICPSCGCDFDASYKDEECEGCRYLDEPEDEDERRVFMNDKLADAFVAIRDHDWELVQRGKKKILVPPQTDERRSWAAIWDADGLPHWLPKFTQGEK